jgi:type I site-specific restriction endonuclease
MNEARAARRIVEAALQHAGWPWNTRLSRWLDALVELEERGR